MKCSKPYRAAGQEFPCRQCLPCRFTRQKLWSARLYWELSLHRESYFVTLTYADEYLPEGGTLEPRQLKLFLMRLRKDCGKFRYFAVGEYGDKSWRPHYHLLLFGFPFQKLERIQRCWKFGFVHIGVAERGSLRYITGYCTKGFTSGPRAEEKLRGRELEFVRMSLKPGIGAGIVDSIPLTAHGVALADVLTGRDVPGVLRMDGRQEFMGAYLRKRLRRRLGRDSGAPEEEIAARQVDYWTRVKDPEELKKMEAAREFAASKVAALNAINRAKRLKV